MSKVCIKTKIQINCASKPEVEAIMEHFRSQGYHTNEVIHYSIVRNKYSITMFTNYKKLEYNKEPRGVKV